MKKIIYYIAIITSITLIFSGCSGKDKVEKNNFFDEWSVKAETSKGFSPSIDPGKSTPIYQTQSETKKEKDVDSEVKKERELPKTIMSLKVTDTDLPIVLRSLARSADINILINQKITGKVTMNIKDGVWDDVFRGILSMHGLTYDWKGDILCILTNEDIEINQKFEPLEIRVLHINYADPVTLRDNLIQFLNTKQDSTSSTKKQKSSIEAALGGLGGGGTKASTSNSSSNAAILVDPHTNSLMIQAVKSDLDRIIPLIKKLDRPTRQITIEAYIVEANQTTANNLGILWGSQSHSAGGASTWIGTKSGDLSTGASGDGFSGVLGGVSGTSGLNIGMFSETVGKSLLSMQLSALQTAGSLNILSKPTITTLDNKKATIESGKEIPFQVVEEGEVSIIFKKAVISLEIVPHVIDENTLKLEITTSKDEIDSSVEVNGNPGIITKKASTEVVLFNGQTTVIGGLKKEKTTTSESGVPLLMNIPLIGRLFKYDSDTSENDELLIFITPHILKKKMYSELEKED